MLYIDLTLLTVYFQKMRIIFSAWTLTTEARLSAQVAPTLTYELTTQIRTRYRITTPRRHMSRVDVIASAKKNSVVVEQPVPLTYM